MSLDGSLRVEWERKISSNPEVKQAELNLEFHKRKMRQLQEELTSAEVWETELEESEGEGPATSYEVLQPVGKRGGC